MAPFIVLFLECHNVLSQIRAIIYLTNTGTLAYKNAGGINPNGRNRASPKTANAFGRNERHDAVSQGDCSAAGRTETAIGEISAATQVHAVQ